MLGESCANIPLMSRAARIVVPGAAHHVTQRGARRQQTFFTDTDYARYVDLIAEGRLKANVSVVAWCLMPNHVHLILVPQTTDGLVRALSSAHQRYTWVINRRNGWTGYLWQRRFHSTPMDDAHLILAIRYVELNPVRARLVERPEEWRWSSVRGRVSGTGDALIEGARPELLANVADWKGFLAEGLDEANARRIRSIETKETVLGGPAFVRHVETMAGRSLETRPRGRPRKWGHPPFSERTGP